MKKNIRQKNHKEFHSMRRMLHKNAEKYAKAYLRDHEVKGITPRFVQRLASGMTTPAEIDRHVEEFCRSINPTAEPFFLDVEPEPTSKTRQCGDNVQAYCKEHGGLPVVGYTIWYFPEIHIIAERHVIWRSPEGAYRDITEPFWKESRVLFLPDTEDKQDFLLNSSPIQHVIDPRAVVYATGYQLAYEQIVPAKQQAEAEIRRLLHAGTLKCGTTGVHRQFLN